MCQFCESLTDKSKEIEWKVRSTYADDNICEMINEHSCGCCKECIMSFKLSGYTYNDDVYVGVDYHQELENANGERTIIRPFSESMQWNYCPVCGKQISKDIREWGSYYSNQIEINDIE